MDHLSINAPMLNLPEIYRALFGLLEGMLKYDEHIPIVTNPMCRIVVPTSLRHIICNLIHTTSISEHTGKCKVLYHIRLRFF